MPRQAGPDPPCAQKAKGASAASSGEGWVLSDSRMVCRQTVNAFPHMAMPFRTEQAGFQRHRAAHVQKGKEYPILLTSSLTISLMQGCMFRSSPGTGRGHGCRTQRLQRGSRS